MATATEQALDAYGDPVGILDQAVMANILGLTDAPAIDPMGLVNIERGGAISPTNVYGIPSSQSSYVTEPVDIPPYAGLGSANFPIQQAPIAESSFYANVPNLSWKGFGMDVPPENWVGRDREGGEAPLPFKEGLTFEDLGWVGNVPGAERYVFGPESPITGKREDTLTELYKQRELLDKLFASGVMSAPEGYVSPVDVHAAGEIPGHAMSSDTFGYQAGLKAALTKQLHPTIGEPLYRAKQFIADKPPELSDAQWEQVKAAKKANADIAFATLGAAQRQPVGDTYLQHIDASLPLTDMINNRGVVQDDFRASYDAQHPELFTTPVSQALQGIFPQGAPTSLMEEAQPPRSLPIGTPGWQPNLGGTLSPYNIHGDVDVLDTTSQLSELARGIGTDDPNVMSQSAQSLLASFEETPEIADIVNKQISQAFRGSDAANFWRAINPISSAQAAIDRDAEFERQQRVPPPISREQEIENMMIEDRAEQLRFHPSSPLYEAPLPDIPIPEVETFADIPVVQPGAEVPWTPPAPVVPDITEELVDFSALQSAREADAQRAQDKIDRQLEHAANVRRKDEEKARLASARNAKSEQARINKENKERKAEEKRIADKQAADEKQRRLIDKQMADMLKHMEETRQAYLARKKEEEDRRKRLGYGVGAMYT